MFISFLMLVGLVACKPSFTVDEERKIFLLDDQPFRYISGSIHYFRIHQEKWEERLFKVRALGFNAIQFYIPWNMHQVYENKTDFSGFLDLGRWIRTAEKLGLFSIVRIGPYICAEHENGGLPWWILSKNVTKQRSMDPIFTNAVENWMNVLLPKLVPFLRKNGGPILMLQIENEYGSYDACDGNYTVWLRDLVRSHVGDDVVLFTTDGAGEGYLKCGTIPDVIPTVDFGPTDKKGVEAAFQLQRKFGPNAPLVNSEYYSGWLLHWGETKQSLPSKEDVVNGAQAIWDLGGSINFYMIHGGTNFGFWNGAHQNAPVITSYDYSAPITEAGDITPYYLAIRSWVKSLPDWKNRPFDVPANSTKSHFGTVKLDRVASVADFDNSDCIKGDNPVSFEQLGHPLGFVSYETDVSVCGNLTLTKFSNIAYIIVNGKFEGSLYNEYHGRHQHSLNMTNCDKRGNHVLVVVENTGRINYETVNDYKGLLGDVLIDGTTITGWRTCGIDLSSIRKSHFDDSADSVGVYSGQLVVNTVSVHDTWLYLNNWGKGFALLNGVNIGRYWSSQGPQMTLYIPSEWLHPGPNLLMLVELEGVVNSTVSFIDHPIWHLD